MVFGIVYSHKTNLLGYRNWMATTITQANNIYTMYTKRRRGEGKGSKTSLSVNFTGECTALHCKMQLLLFEWWQRQARLNPNQHGTSPTARLVDYFPTVSWGSGLCVTLWSKIILWLSSLLIKHFIAIMVSWRSKYNNVIKKYDGPAHFRLLCNTLLKNFLRTKQTYGCMSCSLPITTQCHRHKITDMAL